MARIRTIKPDAFTSDSLSSVPRGTRWTFAGLWTYADDKGRGRDDVRLIKAALYPLDDDVSLEDVAHDLNLLAQLGGICRYVVDGRGYLHMPKWGHQKINRPTPAKSPPCPEHEDGGSGHVLHVEDSVSDHGVISEPSPWEREGKGREKEGSTCASADAERESDIDSDFAEWYAIYPRKKGRGQAVKAYRAARKKVDADTLLDAIRVQADLLMSKGADYAPYPASWLNGERWDDEVDNVHQLPTQADGWFQPFTMPPAPAEVEEDPDAYAEWAEGRRRAWQAGERW